jgi:hypothetical protein
MLDLLRGRNKRFKHKNVRIPENILGQKMHKFGRNVKVKKM